MKADRDCISYILQFLIYFCNFKNKKVRIIYVHLSLKILYDYCGKLKEKTLPLVTYL